MANYTLTGFSTTENINDSIFFNNMATSGNITIAPNSGYVVSASDFSVSSLPSSIASVVFTDTTTAGAVGNTVTGLATFAASFVASENTDITLDIVGDAKVFTEKTKTLSFESSIKNDTNKNTFGSAVFTANAGYTFTTSSPVNGVATTSTSATLTNNLLTKIGTLIVTASANYHFRSKPYLFYDDNSNYENIVIKTTNTTRNSNGEITVYNFDVLAKISIDTTTSDINLKYTATPISSTSKLITGVKINSTQLSSLGGDKTIKVQGTSDAEFSIIVIKDSDSSSILSRKNDSILTSSFGAIDAFTKKIYSRKTFGLGSCLYNQTFPAGTGTYSVSIIPKQGTSIASGVTTEYTITQLANPVITLTVSTTNARITTTAVPTMQFTGRPNTRVEKLKHNKGVLSYYSIDIPLTTNGGPTFNAPSTINWSNTNQSASSWTNSAVSSSNGNNKVEMVKIAATRSNGNNNLNITFKLLLISFGDASVTMNLNLDSIVTTS